MSFISSCADAFHSYYSDMKTLQIHMPDDLDLTAGVTAEELETLARITFAVRLFKMGKVTSGQAAEIAGLSRRRFLLELADHGIPAVSWDDEELVAESAAISQSS
jgi:predicted HTH domain antitoxin